MRLHIVIVIAALLPSTAQAQERTIIKAGRLIDTVAGKVLHDQTIVITGDRVALVGKLNVDQSGARVIDLSEYTVLPGLIDMHVHLTGDHRYHGYKRLELSIPRQTLHGAMNALITLQAGFTSARNVGASGYSDVALRDAINAGEIDGPRLRVSGPALGITGGHCDNNLLPPSYDWRAEGVADGPWAVRAKVRENIKYGVDLIKYCATGGVLSKGDSVGGPQYTLEEMQALVNEAHMHGRKVAAHAHGAEGIKRAITAGVDSIEHSSLIDDEGIRLAKKNGTYLVMDVYNDTFILEHGAKVGMLPESLEKERQIGQLQRDNFKKAFKSGARMAFGSDAAVYPHGHNGKQFAYMVEYGMTPMQAVQAATIHAAELIGWPDTVGAIETGRYADIIAIKGDPLADVSLFESIRFVMKGGKVYKSDD
ncbi:MAG: amidohydrolase family protein [Gammaproteobacteria bacterium]|nr:amidohydrolase family protein [Gammaproteobacteria bacterium]MDH3767586.1 amidohydrolase family protein [Gammaproteobacteria bacterium]